jgi:adenylylsulfate kinase-like enzyme
MSAIVAAISPYREARRKARQLCGEFVEVFVDCPLETLKQRDPKGLYRRALAGEIQHISGISDPYEAPDKPEVHIHSDLLSEEESLERLLFRLKELGYLQTLR